MTPSAVPLPPPPSRTSRALALVRRWLSAAAGLVLLIITLSGTVLPVQGESLRPLNPSAHSHGAGPDQVWLPQAIATIERAHPDEPVVSATWVDDVIEVRTEHAAYTVDPSAGGEISRAATAPPWIAALDNLHRCLLSCQGPGHVRWMSQEIPHTRWWDESRGLTVGGLIVATSGVVLLVLAVSGLRVWWPLQRYRRTALSAGWRSRRLSRDTDLLKAAGLVLLPLLFLWGYYASAFGIHPTRQASPASVAVTEAPGGRSRTDQGQDIGPRRALAAAQQARGGRPVALFLPEPDDPSSTYTVWLSQGARNLHQRSSGSIAVSVDPGTGRTTVPPAPDREPSARAG
ncbi:PepSY domain-containing protein [Actinomyces sp. ZJ308]|uniref:PepSY domain-containing protein n=1 Tax=Actinomyces sp. ZJ308 TaxID=2708342 RepID=UPI00141FC89C|nr:PepSY domain-containing protein [Actinomyces sp. ZJ308]